MIDSYFETGSSHMGCEDYALHGTIENMEYGIVADGCSSATHTEIGAQILCHVARYYLILYYQTGLFITSPLKTLSALLGSSILKRADELRKLYPITPEALQATLLILIRIDKEVFLFVWGDGVIIEKYSPPEGSDAVPDITTKIDYLANTPFYLCTDTDRYKDYLLKEHGIKEPQKIIETFFYGVLNNETVVPFNTPYVLKLDRHCNLESITICTDGILSFKDENKDLINFIDILPEVTQFKSTVGEFVKRRMGFFKRSVQKKQWTHFDDLGTATIIME